MTFQIRFGNTVVNFDTPEDALDLPADVFCAEFVVPAFKLLKEVIKKE